MSSAIESNRGIRLDVGRADNKQGGFLSIDGRDLPGTDILHDIESFPYPIKDNECHIILVRFVLERIKPWLTVDFFNELWRIIRPDGQLAIATPYAGSQAYWQDPLNCNGFTEFTFQYFDPKYPVWKKHMPKPWSIAPGFPLWQSSGTIECVMGKVIA